MTKCDGCGNEVGRLYCAKCRALIEKKKRTFKHVGLIPLLYYDTKNKCYRAGCAVVLCPCNHNGVCTVGEISFEILKMKLHMFDGDNIIKQVCG